MASKTKKKTSLSKHQKRRLRLQQVVSALIAVIIIISFVISLIA